MGDYGLKVSLPGHSVESATLQQQAFNSQYALFKIAFSGSLSITVPAQPDSTHVGQATVAFNHNLGYVPSFRCYGYGDLGQTQRQALDFISNFGLTDTNEIVADITATTLTIRGFNFNSSPFTTTVFYYIYYDPGT